VGVDLDAEAGKAASARSGPHLEEAPVELHGVIVLDGARVLETADAVEVGARWSWPPGGLGVRRGVSEASIVAREKAVEHALGLRERARLGEPEFDDEAILEGAKEPFDPSLGLRRMRTDPADAQFLEGAPNLGGRGAALKLLGHGQRGAGIAVEDPVAVSVRCTGQAIAADEVAEEQEVAVRILFQAEDAAEDLACGVINGRVEYQPRPAIFEPGVVTAIQLDEEAGLGHAVSAAAMAGRAAGAGAADALGAEQPLHGGTREPQALALSEQVREVVIVRARVGRAGQREDASPDGLGHAPRGGAAAVAVGQGREALLAEAGQQPAEVATGKAQKPGGFLRRKHAVVDASQEVGTVLFLGRQGNRLPGHAPTVTDSLSR
jgi:hypothetical protein